MGEKNNRKVRQNFINNVFYKIRTLKQLFKY